MLLASLRPYQSWLLRTMCVGGRLAISSGIRTLQQNQQMVSTSSMALQGHTNSNLGSVGV